MDTCKLKPFCRFFKRKIPIHDVMYRTDLNRYCDGIPQTCAIYQVMEKAGFLEVPDDLLPNQSFRVQKILGGIHRTYAAKV